MRRLAGLIFLLAVLVLTAGFIGGGPSSAEASGRPKFMWDPNSGFCIPIPLDCDIIIVGP